MYYTLFVHICLCVHAKRPEDKLFFLSTPYTYWRFELKLSGLVANTFPTEPSLLADNMDQNFQVQGCLFNFMCIDVLPMWMYVHAWCLERSEKWHQKIIPPTKQNKTKQKSLEFVRCHRVMRLETPSSAWATSDLSWASSPVSPPPTRIVPENKWFCKCVGVFSAYMSMHCMCAVPAGVQERESDRTEPEFHAVGCVPPGECWELNLGPQEE